MKKNWLLLFSLMFSIHGFSQNYVETDEAKEERVRQIIENEKDNSVYSRLKPKLFFGGQLDLHVMYDSYQNVDSRGGVLYYYPSAPSYNSYGEDLNKEGQLRASMFASRFNFGVKDVSILNAIGKAYVEVDFMGASDTYLQHIRLRQAHFTLDWEKDQLLLGQTSSLTTVSDVMSNSIMFGGGVPFNPLHRGVQARYTRKFTPSVKFLVAAEMYTAHKPAGPSDQQTLAAIPDLHMQMQFGDNSSIMGGFTFGGKFLQPRTVDAQGYKINTIVASYDASLFLKANVDSYTIKVYTIYGGNMSGSSYIGGYAKLLDESASGDYKYGNTYSISAWGEFESPVVNQFSYGLFYGYEKNLGSHKKLDLSKSSDGEFKYGYFRDNDLVWTSRISPRFCYVPTKSLLFGLEYSYCQALWGKSFDEYYVATEVYPVSVNHRVEFFARFKF